MQCIHGVRLKMPCPGCGDENKLARQNPEEYRRKFGRDPPGKDPARVYGEWAWSARDLNPSGMTCRGRPGTMRAPRGMFPSRRQSARSFLRSESIHLLGRGVGVLTTLNDAERGRRGRRNLVGGLRQLARHAHDVREGPASGRDPQKKESA